MNRPWLPRWRWRPRGGSLQRLLLVGLLAPLWTVVALIGTVQAVQQARMAAAAQDVALRAALVRWAAPPSGDAPVDPARGGWYQESSLDGQRLAGNAALPPLPPLPSGGASAMPGDGAPHFYLTQVDGQLARVAAVLHQPVAAQAPPGDAQAVWRQVARPFSERLPSVQGLVGEGAGLRAIVLLALAMTVLVAAVARVASSWLRDAGLSLTQPGGEGVGAGYEGPSELGPAVQQFGELQQSKSRWIDAQRRFLADATHQMRTPMAVLRTQLQSAIAGDVEVAHALHDMLHTVDRASNLANQLLSLSKVEQLKRMGALPSVDLNATAREAIKELAPLIAAKRLDFALEGPSELSAPGDAALLGELVRNLLANAIHHAPVHGRLGVLLRNSTGRRELLVWDEGPGIDDALRERIFQPFSAGKGGVGLGLSICRQIAESMGAEVTLFNRMDEGRVVGVDALVAWEN